MVVDVNDTDSHDFQSTLIIPSTARPKVTNPERLMFGLGYIGRIDSAGSSSTCEILAIGNIVVCQLLDFTDY